MANPKVQANTLLNNSEYLNQIETSRNIKVFVSSTFEDLKRERDYLMKHVLPKIQGVAAARGVSFSPIDLRWGITRRESLRGETIRICLDEINRSKPFFIGIIGNRYGSLPKQKDIEKDKLLLSKYEWIKDSISNGLSYTEIEMQYAVFDNYERMDAAFFIKDSKPTNDKKLECLKKKIYNNGKYPYFKYKTLRQFGKKVEESLLALLDKYFPLEKQGTAQRIDIIQEATLLHNIRVTVENPSILKNVDSFIKKTSGPFVAIVGLEGSGKTVLLSQWINYIQNNECDVVYFFCGQAQMGNIVDEVSRYLYRHITRITGFEEDIDEAYDSTLKLSMALSKVRTHRPFYIILDGFVDLLTLNKDGRYQFAEYLFSFSYIPHNVKFVFSCRSDNLEYITKTCIPYLCFKRMGMNKFKAVIEKNLSDVGKRLPSKQKSQILKSSIGDNVFMLTVFFELLKNYGSFDSIDNDILSLFEIHSQDQFVLQYIERMDIVYPEIKIKRIIGILLSSKCGFTENELAALSNINQINVSIFRSIMKPFLSIVNGRIRISSNIINKMEFAISECRQIILDVIGEFYQNTSKKHRQLRAIYGLELSWQYYIQKNYKKLREILLDWRNFIYFYENHLEYLVQLWRCLESLKDPDYSLKLYQIDLFTFDCPPKDLKVFDTYLTKLISNYFYDNNYVFDQMTNISVALEIYKETENNIVRNSRFSELLEKLQIGRTLSNNDYVGREVLLEIINSTSSKRKKLGYMLLYLDASIAYCDIYHSKYSYRDINEDDEDNRGVYNTKMLFLKDVIKDVNYYGICKNPLVQIKVAKIWIILAECQRRLHKSRNALCSVNMALKILSRYRTNHLCEFTVAEAIALQTSAFIYADLRKTNKAIARSLLSIERWNNLHTMHGHKFRIQHVDAIISLGIIYAMDYEYFESSREFSRAWRILDKEYFYEDQSDIMLQKQHEIERLQMKQGLYEYSEKDAERFERCAEGTIGWTILNIN